MKGSVLIPAVIGTAVIVQWPSTFWWTCLAAFIVGGVLEAVQVTIGSHDEN